MQNLDNIIKNNNIDMINKINNVNIIQKSIIYLVGFINYLNEQKESHKDI